VEKGSFPQATPKYCLYFWSGICHPGCHLHLSKYFSMTKFLLLKLKYEKTFQILMVQIWNSSFILFSLKQYTHLQPVAIPTSFRWQKSKSFWYVKTRQSNTCLTWLCWICHTCLQFVVAHGIFPYLKGWVKKIETFSWQPDMSHQKKVKFLQIS